MHNELEDLSNESSTPREGCHGTTPVPGLFPTGHPFYNQPKNHFDLLSTPSPVLESENSAEKFEHLNDSASHGALAKVTQFTGRIVKQGEYLPEYGPLMYDWFSSKEKVKIAHENFVWKNGSVEEKKREIPNPPPHFSDFARNVLGVTKKRLEKWAKENEEFNEYYEACKDIVQEFIVDNGIVGNYSAQFGIFVAKNLTNMRDVVVNKNENYNMKEFLDALESGKDMNMQSHDI
jgi:hypothetical protein